MSSNINKLKKEIEEIRQERANLRKQINAKHEQMIEFEGVYKPKHFTNNQSYIPTWGFALVGGCIASSMFALLGGFIPFLIMGSALIGVPAIGLISTIIYEKKNKKRNSIKHKNKIKNQKTNFKTKEIDSELNNLHEEIEKLENQEHALFSKLTEKLLELSNLTRSNKEFSLNEELERAEIIVEDEFIIIK